MMVWRASGCAALFVEFSSVAGIWLLFWYNWWFSLSMEFALRLGRQLREYYGDPVQI